MPAPPPHGARRAAPVRLLLFAAAAAALAVGAAAQQQQYLADHIGCYTFSGGVVPLMSPVPLRKVPKVGGALACRAAAYANSSVEY